MWQKTVLPPALHLVATPIGAARDITLRALDVLGSADLLAAEDTRTLRKLMDIHGIPLGGRPLVAYHDHNGPQARPRLLQALADGQSVAYASEAGTPLVADPGFALARAAIAEGHAVVAVPGASATLAALTVAGLPTDRFLFAGFPPSAGGARRSFLTELAGVAATVVIYESPNRIQESLGDLVQIFGAGRMAALCRELTKRFEEVRRGTLADLADGARGDPPRGEHVLVIDRAPEGQVSGEDMDAALRRALETMSVKAAAEAVAGAMSLPKRMVYQAALRVAGKGGGE